MPMMKTETPRGQTEHYILRLTSIVTFPDSVGTPVHKLQLSCWSTTYTAFADSTCIIDDHDLLQHFALLYVIGYRSGDDASPVLHLTYIGKPTFAQVMRLPCLHSLPRCLSPLPEVSDQLVSAVNSLQTFQLRHFLKYSLERSDRLEGFMLLPASQRDHHAYPGGLMAHSLEVAQLVAGMIQLNEPDMPLVWQETAFVAGLLHDLGKVRVYRKGGFKQPTIALVDHDQLTLELCAHGLEYLDQSLPDIADTLRHLWTCASPGARYGKPAMMTLARYLRDADGQNAMADKQKRVSRGYARFGFRSINNQRFWLPNDDAATYKVA